MGFSNNERGLWIARCVLAVTIIAVLGWVISNDIKEAMDYYFKRPNIFVAITIIMCAVSSGMWLFYRSSTVGVRRRFVLWVWGGCNVALTCLIGIVLYVGLQMVKLELSVGAEILRAAGASYHKYLCGVIGVLLTIVVAKSWGKLINEVRARRERLGNKE